MLLLLRRFVLRTWSPVNALRAALARFGSSTSQASSTPRWDLVGAVALERKPVIVPELNALERKYLEILHALEVEGSLLSDHELQLLEDKKRRADPEEGVAITVQTAQDIEDEWTRKAKEFKPAPRLTEADRKGDTRTTHRCLDQPLLLVVNQQLGKGHRWILPQAVHAHGETMRQVFFFKAQLRNGTLSVGDLKKLTKADDFAWLTYKELCSKMLPRYCKAVRSFIMAPDETPYQHLLDRALSSVTWQKSSITPEIPREDKAAVEVGKS
ncbi:hypothetical protein HPB51_017192 [Rhipicephalus microplus]|uniref:Large ribosomal subunit protein mL46 N-terminal domain-containing protein n=1 Tax=Rhipicephalus microplus TaxID=6941 RepID=A0A9J6EAU6_RHIMP|nr:hypothetical protein HPB51_017192 [Rhipicephalus microplus]